MHMEASYANTYVPRHSPLKYHVDGLKDENISEKFLCLPVYLWLSSTYSMSIQIQVP